MGSLGGSFGSGDHWAGHLGLVFLGLPLHSISIYYWPWMEGWKPTRGFNERMVVFVTPPSLYRFSSHSFR